METMLLLDELVPDIDPGLLAAVKRFGDTPTAETEVPWGLSAKETAALLLAKAASTSPASVSEITVATVSPTLASDEIVEIVVWLSLLQTLNRLYSFLEVTMLDDDALPASNGQHPPPVRAEDRPAADQGYDAATG
jgi:alkylhydroperoxidase family enzyme